MSGWDVENAGGFEFRMVPPPEKAPQFTLAKKLGLHPCLKVDESSGGWRCGYCNKIQRPGYEVWLGENTSFFDSASDIEESCRQRAYNGESTAWCLSCARGVGKNPLRRLIAMLRPLYSWLW